MNSKEINKLKEGLKLTKDQREILVGLLLGDGHLETRNNGRTYRLKIEHSINQKDYVEWLYKIFKPWVPGGIYERKREKGHFVGFNTYSHGSFRFYGQQFYPSGKKVIPKMIDKLMTPISLAIWFMDDGSKKSKRHRTFIIHTLGFKKEDLERVIGVLHKKFKVVARLHKQKEIYWRLYITSQSVEQFTRLTDSTVSKIPSMNHKMDNIMPKK